MNASCLTDFNDINVTACQEIRNATDMECARTTCYPLVTSPIPGGGLDIPIGFFYDLEPENYSFIDLIANGSTNIMEMVTQYANDNVASSFNPVLPLPRPLEGPTFELTPANLSDNMQNTAREFGREMLVAELNVDAVRNLTALTPPAYGGDVFNTWELLVYTPLRCRDPELLNIAWAQAATVTAEEAFYGAAWMFGLNVTSPQCDPENWLGDLGCLYWTAWPDFCDQFPDYYSFASLRDFSIVPSPWADLVTFLRVWNEEYRNCGEPVGCMGVPT